MSLTVATWNVEWATPRSRRTGEILRRIDHHAPDVVCVTETHNMLLSRVTCMITWTRFTLYSKRFDTV